MSRIFLSYRRADSSGYLVALYPRLENHFGRDNIFRDLDTIDYGVDFVKTIEDAVQSCDVLLAVIGPHWVNLTDSQGHRRLENPNDFVRLEVATALARDIRVIPLLVGGAVMPYVDELPDDLKLLARRNALEIVDRDFEAHVGRLIAALEQAIGPKGFGFPALEWISIPGGSVEIEEYGAFKVYDFHISKYPVTVEQYTSFVDDGGYYERQCWTDLGWAWREEANIKSPKYWNEPRWHIANHPVVGVSWYEAVAFCQWLNNKLSEGTRLPTEMQWQRAAQGSDGRLYPWGNEFNTKFANTKESGIGKTTPVNQYPGGVSPYGVMDITGNVWEWCMNVYNAPGTVQPVGSGPRTVRGGSWNAERSRSNCTARSHNNPGYRYDLIGFRLSCDNPAVG